MNRSEQFEQRRKYRTTEDLANQLEVWEERLRKKEGSFTMCVPPDINDTDIVIEDAVNRLRKLQKENEELKVKNKDANDFILGVAEMVGLDIDGVGLDDIKLTHDDFAEKLKKPHGGGMIWHKN